MYFLTLPDPDYMVKGSRDPLGFQVLWQAAGRQLIPHLSTVSNSIRDFQVISLAQFCKEKYKISERNYGLFFTCFEQLMAFSRFRFFKGEDSFNGIDRVRKILLDNSLQIDIGEKFQLLSNQRSYGIWGKYNRPFFDIGIADDKIFKEIQRVKLEDNALLMLHVERLIKSGGDRYKVSKEELEDLGTVFEVPTGEEKQCYIKYLLSDHFNGELLKLVNKYPDTLQLSFYKKIDFLIDQTTNVQFSYYLKQLCHTERVLSPLNRIFRHLQDQSFWRKEEINNSEFITSCRNSEPLHPLNHIPSSLSGLLDQANWDLVMGLLNVNAKVCSNRGSSSWMTKTTDGLEINRFEGAYTSDKYNPVTDNDHSYFLDTWLNLYRQLNYI